MRVVIGEDSALLREGLARLLCDHGMDVVGLAVTVEEILDLVRQTRPDVAIVDIRLPPTYTDEGIRAAEAIRADKDLSTGVLVLSQYLDVSFATRLLGTGRHGVGYMLKDTLLGSTELATTIERIRAGESVIDPALVRALFTMRRRNDPLDRLTTRERGVLELMAQGRSNAGTAHALAITEKTVEFHVSSIFAKLGLEASEGEHRRVLAVLAYLEDRRGVGIIPERSSPRRTP